MIMRTNNIALAINKLRELIMVAVGVHQQRPMHEVQIDVVQPQALEGLFETQLAAGRVGGPDLGHDEDVLTFHDARRKGFLQTGADFVFVAVAVGRVD